MEGWGIGKILNQGNRVCGCVTEAGAYFMGVGCSGGIDYSLLLRTGFHADMHFFSFVLRVVVCGWA